MLSVEVFGWWTRGCFPSSAVCGLSDELPLEKSPWAFGADATRRSFLASSSFPAVVAWSSVPFSASIFGIGGVSGGDGGTLPSL